MDFKQIEVMYTDIAGLKAELEDNEKTLAACKQECFERLVQARNSHTARRLIEDKKQHLPTGHHLRIFCVSNAHYEALKGCQETDSPSLSPRATGIPALRSFLLERSAPGLWQATENYIGHQLSVFISGLAMSTTSYTTSGNMQAGETLLKAMSKPQSKIQLVLDQYRKKVMMRSGNLIVDPLRFDAHAIVDRALQVLNAKLPWNWSTLRAFVRRDGNHSTSVAPPQSFNEQFAERAINCVHAQWDEFIAATQELSVDLRDELYKLVRKIIVTIANRPLEIEVPKRSMDDMLGAQINGIKQACIKHQDDMEKELRNIKLDMIHDQHTGFFTKAMYAVYDAANADGGKGVKKRTFRKFTHHLSLSGDDSPFSRMCASFRKAVGAETDAKSGVLANKIHDIIDQILHHVDSVVKVKYVDGPETKLNMELAESSVQAKAKVGTIERDLAALKRQYEA